jgi:plasmid stabilization system protein ParE
VIESYNVVWAPNAIRDLDEILDYVAATRSADEAERLYLKIVPRIDSLSRFPRRARLVPELKRFGVHEYRELVVSPYRILFRIIGQVVAILGVLDGRRELSELLLNRALEPLPFE